jgi:hypothetical protein
MHRVELKAFMSFQSSLVWFLMHRVELKEPLRSFMSKFNRPPCGVSHISIVPNAPCGVESLFQDKVLIQDKLVLFLMHRVELKVLLRLSLEFQTNHVPNAPCGVERRLPKNSKCVENQAFSKFLMHRVELKVFLDRF